MNETDAPIKTCEYCGKVGKMPTFRGGDTCCEMCLLIFAPGNTETRRREHQLRAALDALVAAARGVDEWLICRPGSSPQMDRFRAAIAAAEAAKSGRR